MSKFLTQKLIIVKALLSQQVQSFQTDPKPAQIQFNVISISLGGCGYLFSAEEKKGAAARVFLTKGKQGCGSC